MKFVKTTAFSLLIASVAFSCQDQAEDSSVAIPTPNAQYVELQDLGLGAPVQARTASGNLALYTAEYITSGESEELGNTIYFNNRGNKQLAADFAPGMSGDGSDAISYYVDNNRPSEDLALSTSTAAIDRAMTSWNNEICSDLGMTKVPADGRSTGFVAALFSSMTGQPFGGSFDYVADVNHAGWLPKSFFNLLTANGGDFILGVTFTIIFTDANGNPVDTNNDGKADVAFREIYYNDHFPWNDGAHYDVETIALHEAGHGLSQGHFGKAFKTVSNNKIHFSPRAVMNAAYTGILTSVEKTDQAGHCSIWANWNNK